MTRRKAYARAGVDVDLGNRLKRQIRSLVRKTHGPEVLGNIGGFGGLFAPNFRGIREPVLVASVDLNRIRVSQEGWRFLNNRRPQTYTDLVR